MIDEPEGLADDEDDRAEASDAKTPDVLGADNGMDHDEQIVAFYEREELLPTPDILAEYYAISRDTGDRVVGLAEQALTHGRASKQEDFRLTRIAFISIPVTTIAFIAGATLAVIFVDLVSGIVIGFGGPLGLSLFSWSRRKRDSDTE